MSLKSQLEELTTKLRALVPAERLAVVERAADELKSSGTADRALKAGDSFSTSFHTKFFCRQAVRESSPFKFAPTIKAQRQLLIS